MDSYDLSRLTINEGPLLQQITPPPHRAPQAFVCHVWEGLPGAVYIGREGPYGCPFNLGPWESRKVLLDRFRAYLWNTPSVLELVPALRFKPLACFCRRHKEFGPPCHGDVYVALLEAKTDEEILQRVKELRDADNDA